MKRQIFLTQQEIKLLIFALQVWDGGLSKSMGKLLTVGQSAAMEFASGEINQLIERLKTLEEKT